MPSPRENLIEAIKNAFAAFQDKPERTVQNVANELGAAIEEFVKKGKVVGITTAVEVKIDSTTYVGTGTQDKSGIIEFEEE